jgi:hypothetical protein
MKRLCFITLTVVLFLAACGPQVPPATATATIIPTATPFPTPTIAPTPVPGVLYVDPGIGLGPISPYIYGTNYGPAQAIPLGMLPLIMDSGFTALRFPGGAWGDRNNLQNFNIDQFMGFCKQMGALPTISVRLRQGTPEAAAGLVRYANIEKKYGIVYWSIGNEPTLFAAELQETYDTERLNKEWRAIAEAMKAVDPSIKLIGPDLHQWEASYETTLKDSSGRDWMTEFLKANGDLIDVVTVHRYPLAMSGTQNVTIEMMRENTRKWTGEITYLRSLIRETTGRDIPMAFTEVNSNPSGAFGGAATPDTFYNAIWYADVLGHMIQQRVFMVNYWVISQRTGGLGLISGSTIRPTLYVFHLYKHFGSELVYAASGVENVNVYAAKREDGALTVLVINLLDTGQRVPLQVQGLELDRAEIWLLDATHNAENLGAQQFPADGVLELPGQSATLYIIGQP